jgi:DNA-binding HxlR family transcriptional regulator
MFISSLVLNLQLNQLESHELISKRIYAELPPRVEYSLTELGRPCYQSSPPWGNGETIIKNI